MSDHLHQMVIDSSIAGLRGRHRGFQVFLGMSPTSPQGKIVPIKPSLQQPGECTFPQALLTLGPMHLQMIFK